MSMIVCTAAAGFGAMPAYCTSLRPGRSATHNSSSAIAVVERLFFISFFMASPSFSGYFLAQQDLLQFARLRADRIDGNELAELVIREHRCMTENVPLAVRLAPLIDRVANLAVTETGAGAGRTLGIRPGGTHAELAEIVDHPSAFGEGRLPLVIAPGDEAPAVIEETAAAGVPGPGLVAIDTIELIGADRRRRFLFGDLGAVCRHGQTQAESEGRSV
ncbi:hypothetical protein CUJ84_Chr004844 [Rhizobium leguminosarum]|uniref:Uncharacterized protein n=1 Tax=Rhizobium leguminosarum TaxID=384 RepID=A0A2K9ZA82_RHILE|nr:hypothetical protein CUJ84_Chr004844 [Rhizobium leguminosarum]